MRRALDVAKSKLASLTERDAILDCFFEHGRSLFQYSALFVVRGDAAHGRCADGVGAPTELVARLTFPLDEPGILTRARELRRPFVASPSTRESDAHLFGSLGRAMPEGLVVPLVVRDRVVAIFLGDVPSDPLQKRAREAERSAVELTKDEMLIWAQSVGEALEGIILRRKGAGGSVPPPKLGSVPPPPRRPGSLAPPRMPAPGSLYPAEPALSAGAPSPFLSPLSMSAPDEEPEVAAPSSARGRGFLIGVAAAIAIGAGALAFGLGRGGADVDRVAVAGDKLAGWPKAVDPAGALEAAQTLAGKRALASVRAEIGGDAKVDLSAPPKNADGVLLAFTFVGDADEAEVRVDANGMHAPSVRPRSTCDGKPCRVAVPAPKCSMAQIRAAATAEAGLRPEERALVRYGDGQPPDGSGAPGPEWVLSVVGRGHVRLDPASCKPASGERLLPAALPLASIPGAPKDVDPVALLALARAQSGLGDGAALLEIDARGVDAAGHVDLASEGSGITYTFSDPAAGATRRWRVVEVGKNGMPVTSAEGDTTPIPSRLTGIASPPTCSFAHVYRTVGNLPQGATARVTYAADTTGQGGAFTIDVPSVGSHRRIGDAECAAWEKLVR
jgi:hypothetical protein